MAKLAPAEVYVIERMLEYGSGVNWGGAGANASHRNAAKALIERGLMQGNHQAASMTGAGIAEYRRHQSNARRRAARATIKAFDRDRQEFENASRKT